MNDFKISKFISYILRHNPRGMPISEDGWMKIEDLLYLLKERFSFPICLQDIERIVINNNKKRFKLKENKIRASQGHSNKSIKLHFILQDPPDALYHGTTIKKKLLIEKEGLKKMNRHHVHLSTDEYTATNVAKRWKEQYLVLKIDSRKMKRDGYQFFISDNCVWLTDNVPPHYLEIQKREK